jgi:glycosyltransferase involved in cell wall biosynthesis
VRPKFSIVIPTRARPDTLRYTLQTCLDQVCEDYEIVVCDNCSPPETQRVVEEFNSKRIIHFRSSQPLSMRENWELAYSKSSGKYVMFIGDDDALSPFALLRLEEFLKQHNALALTWRCAVYAWPNVGRSDLANYLQIPISQRLQWYEGKKAIADVTANRIPANLLPNIYHGLAARSVLEEIKKKSGHIFGGYMVDTYSSFAIAYFAERYAHLGIPITISGFSKESHSIALHFYRGNHPNTQSYREDNARSGLNLHPMVPQLPTGWACIADSYLTAREELFSTDAMMNFDRKKFINTLLKKPAINTLQEWPRFIQEIRSSLYDDQALMDWFNNRIKSIQPWVPPKETFRNPLDFIRGSDLRLDAATFGIEDIAAAARLLGMVLPYTSTVPNWNTGGGIFSNWRDQYKARRQLTRALPRPG